MPIHKFKATVKANFYQLSNDRIEFFNSENGKYTYDDWKLIASYPSKYTIIEEVIH